MIRLDMMVVAPLPVCPKTRLIGRSSTCFRGTGRWTGRMSQKSAASTRVVVAAIFRYQIDFFTHRGPSISFVSSMSESVLFSKGVSSFREVADTGKPGTTCCHELESSVAETARTLVPERIIVKSLVSARRVEVGGSRVEELVSTALSSIRLSNGNRSDGRW